MEVKITKLMYSWTKWGGGKKALVTNDRNLINYCQACGKEIPKDFPMYKYEIMDNEYIRICPDCWEVAKNMRKDLKHLKDIVRKVDNLFDSSL